MGKTAFLILAYSSPNVLNEFIEIMDSPNVVFVLHVDAKVNIEEYSKLLRKRENILICSNRYKIYWGGFNMIRATIEMSGIALSDNSIENFCLISDDTFALHEPSKVLNFIKNQPNRIECFSINNSNRYERYNKYYFFDSDMSSARWLPTERRNVDDDDLNNFFRLMAEYQRGKYVIKDIRGGSQWWSMSRKVLTHCIEEIVRNEHLRFSFEFSAIPDEMLFQTLAHDYMHINNINYMSTPMIADFTKDPKPYVYTDVKSMPFGTDEKLFIRKISSAGVERIRMDLDRRFIE